MTQNLNIAVVGATGLVGEAMIEILQERNFPVGTLHPLASERSLGKSVRFRGQELPVAVLDEHDFSDTDIALFSAGASVSENHASRATDAGCGWVWRVLRGLGWRSLETNILNRQ